jgi:hypothetical protein
VKGRVRTYVLHQQLPEHLPAPPAPVLDVGGAAGLSRFRWRQPSTRSCCSTRRRRCWTRLDSDSTGCMTKSSAGYGGWRSRRRERRRGGERDAEQVEAVAAVELEASRRDPYRRLSRTFHLVGRKDPS